MLEKLKIYLKNQPYDSCVKNHLERDLKNPKYGSKIDFERNGS
jgi:hypothetical protein